MTNHLSVSEIFKSIQGEGKYVGTPSVFLRLAGCNLACSWCDTPYSWDWTRFNIKQEARITSDLDVFNQIRSLAGNVRHLVITGGEPLLQRKALGPLLGLLSTDRWFVEFETAGTIDPGDFFTRSNVWFNVSPKLENSGNSLSDRYRQDVLRNFAASGKASFKFVVCSPTDFIEIDSIVSDVGASDVYIMPEGITAEKLLLSGAELVPYIINRGYKFSPRLQVLLYGNKRGV